MGEFSKALDCFFKARNTCVSESKNRLNAVLRLTISAFTWMLRCDYFI